MCDKHHEGHIEKTEKKILSSEETREFIENGNITWVEAKDLLDATAESCVDGRGHDGIVGTPGGNAGEFILALTVVEKAGRQELDLDKVDEILKRYLEKTGKFYFHTDDHHPDPRSGITENTTESEKEKLLETLVKAESIGCGHIGLMTKNPQEYGVRPELLKAVMKSIYKTLWEKPETMEFVVLEGGHKEGAIVNILVDGEVNDDTKIPTVAPSHDDIQIFVNHPQAVKYLRDKIAEDMEYVIGGDLGGEFNLESFKEYSQKIGDEQLKFTINNLPSAKDKPIYNIKISSDDKCEIV